MAKPGLSEFHESSAEKSSFLEPEKLFFLQSQACLNFIRLVCKKQCFRVPKIVLVAKPGFFEFQRIARKKHIFLELDIFFLQSWASLSVIGQVWKKTFF